jgi:hypothetical protein
MRWPELPPFGFLQVHQFDAQVGGRFGMSFATSGRHSFGGQYLELVPLSESLHGYFRQSESARRDADDRQAEAGRVAPTSTWSGKFQHSTEMCYLGWQESLLRLANLVEAEIRG